MRKKTGFLILIAITILLITGIAVASEPIAIIVNGSQIRSDVNPQIISGRTMVPIRVVSQALGADVNWDSKNNAVLITTKYLTQPLLYINGVPSTAPYWYENGELYLECRDMVQLLKEARPHPSFTIAYYYASGMFMVNNTIYDDVPKLKKGVYTIAPLSYFQKKGILDYTFDPASGNLTLVQ